MENKNRRRFFRFFENAVFTKYFHTFVSQSRQYTFTVREVNNNGKARESSEQSEIRDPKGWMDVIQNNRIYINSKYGCCSFVRFVVDIIFHVKTTVTIPHLYTCHAIWYI